MNGKNSYNSCYEGIPESMKLIGIGVVHPKPDTATIKLGVITENTVLRNALEENAAKTNSVINQLLRMNIPKDSISTSYYNIEPQYDYIEGKQIFRNYKITNILSVDLTDLDKIGSVIDAAVNSGANSVQGISFKLENPSEYYNKALNLAIEDSIQKACEISDNLKISLYRIPYKIIEQSSVTPFTEGAAIKFAVASTPILPGELTITARVESSFYYYG